MEAYTSIWMEAPPAPALVTSVAATSPIPSMLKDQSWWWVIWSCWPIDYKHCWSRTVGASGAHWSNSCKGGEPYQASWGHSNIVHSAALGWSSMETLAAGSTVANSAAKLSIHFLYPCEGWATWWGPHVIIIHIVVPEYNMSLTCVVPLLFSHHLLCYSNCTL